MFDKPTPLISVHKRPRHAQDGIDQVFILHAVLVGIAEIAVPQHPIYPALFCKQLRKNASRGRSYPAKFKVAGNHRIPKGCEGMLQLYLLLFLCSPRPGHLIGPKHPHIAKGVIKFHKLPILHALTRQLQRAG